MSPSFPTAKISYKITRASCQKSLPYSINAFKVPVENKCLSPSVEKSGPLNRPRSSRTARSIT